jgi:hypothetical protein
MVDDPDARAGVDAAHLEGCADCQVRFKSISDDARSIATLLAVPEARVDVAAAFDRVTRAPKSQPALGLRFPIVRRPVGLAFAAAVAAAALVIVGFAFSGLLFKPTTVQTVPVTVADVQALSQLADYGTITWTTQPNFQTATNASDAEALAKGLKAPQVSNIPSGISTNVTYGAMSEAVATFTFSADKARAAAASKGKTIPAMPAGMDGATVTFTVGPAIGEVYGDLNQKPNQSSNGTSETPTINLPQLIVARSAAPTAKSTQVSVDQLEQYILEQPGITPELKAAVRAIGNPSTTLLIPVPVQYASSSQVDINGAHGVALGDNTGLGSGVVWVGADGNVYVVAGSLKQQDAINIAKTLK